MKKTVILLAIFMLVGTVSSFAQVRLDANISVPLFVGLQTPSDFLDVDVNVISEFVLPFPEIQLHYVFDMSMIKIGVGARMFMWILANAIVPNAFIELDFNPLVINFSLSGGFAAFFGMFPATVQAGSFLMPDLSVGFQITDWFRLGGGLIAITSLEDFEGSYLYAFYLNARMHFYFK